MNTNNTRTTVSSVIHNSTYKQNTAIAGMKNPNAALHYCNTDAFYCADRFRNKIS